MIVTIVSMKIEDLDQVHSIECECFTIPWSKNEFRREIEENDNSIYFVAMVEGIIVGYAGMWHIINEGHITNIAIKQDYRGNGIADLLVKKLIRTAQEKEMIGITLEVRINNYTAQRLYTKNGFKPEGFRKNYYSDTKEDAIIMWKYL